MPPVATTDATPVDAEEHDVLLSTAAVANNAVGSVIIIDVESVQPLASVTVTEYVPAKTPEIDAVVAELLHAYVYAVVPPVALAVAAPSDAPLQLTLESNAVAAIRLVGCIIITEVLSVHPLTTGVHDPSSHVALGS